MMSAGELESGNAGEPAKLIMQRYREAALFYSLNEMGFFRFLKKISLFQQSLQKNIWGVDGFQKGLCHFEPDLLYTRWLPHEYIHLIFTGGSSGKSSASPTLLKEPSRKRSSAVLDDFGSGGGTIGHKRWRQIL